MKIFMQIYFKISCTNNIHNFLIFRYDFETNILIHCTYEFYQMFSNIKEMNLIPFSYLIYRKQSSCIL